ncbi:hypothetical protein IMZ48_24025 [Candidatus Bathyarchaeota archaeon]|nr:hypothetical protein [Candidatus Bathyarchaeota archaeon]
MKNCRIDGRELQERWVRKKATIVLKDGIFRDEEGVEVHLNPSVLEKPASCTPEGDKQA